MSDRTLRRTRPSAALRKASRGAWSPAPVFFGGMMVKRGDADTMVAGVSTATANVIQPALHGGLRTGITTASSFLSYDPAQVSRTRELRWRLASTP